ncbi:MAG: RIO1 family regulatory kinase/ATPase domain-containing protein [Anaerolineae bacterium]
MTDHAFDRDEYDKYEDQFDPLLSDRQARRRIKPAAHHVAKKAVEEVVTELAAPVGLEAGFVTTYQPSRYESAWLLSSLRPFYEEGHLTDVLALVKGGKEASVYRCQADPHTGYDLLAAKVYRPRQFRNLRNDKMYREGREVLSAGGQVVKKSDHRIMRAIGKKTEFGVQVSHTSWLTYEFVTLQRLYAAGAAVPAPVAASDNAILMGYCGSARRAAPTLIEISLTRTEATALLGETLRNIEVMLQLGIIHGDLSAYNILYWEGKITLIDFPQVTDVHTNPMALPILERDVRRVCEYYDRQGAPSDPDAIVADFWRRYGQAQLPPEEIVSREDDTY